MNAEKYSKTLAYPAKNHWNTISYELDMSNSNGSNISVYM